MERTKSGWDMAANVFCVAVLIAGCCSLPASERPFMRADRNITEFFAYPEDQPLVEAKQNARNRTPIYIPSRCGPNEILYPGDHDSDWVCDCKPTYVYHAPDQQCYQLYTKGFCQPGQILYMEPSGKVPVCIMNNNCSDDKVWFKQNCVRLNAEHEICHLAGLKLVVGINEHTHELECVNVSDVPVNSTAINNRAAQSPALSNISDLQKLNG